MIQINKLCLVFNKKPFLMSFNKLKLLFLKNLFIQNNKILKVGNTGIKQTKNKGKKSKILLIPTLSINIMIGRFNRIKNRFKMKKEKIKLQISNSLLKLKYSDIKVPPLICINSIILQV